MYVPAEDTFLLIRGLEYTSMLGNTLEIGIGSGKVAEKLSDHVKNYVGVDIELSTLKNIKEHLPNIDLVCGDSAKCFVKDYFDTIIFNPPYLPSEDFIDITIDGGINGNEILLKFLKDSFNIIKPSGTIFFIASSLSNLQEVQSFIRENGFSCIEILNKNFLYETISLFKCNRLL
ncbi:MAG: methyltransferase domain-containing protein [Nitrososphaeria archaeon]